MGDIAHGARAQADTPMAVTRGFPSR